MKNKEILKLEKELVKLKFKKVEFDDKSGYWFEKIIKTKHFKYRVCCDPDPKFQHLYLSVEVYSSGQFFNLKERCYEDIYRFIPSLKHQITLKEVEKVIKMI